MSGTIAVTSESGVGTTFTVRMPAEVVAFLYTMEHPIPVAARISRSLPAMPAGAILMIDES